MLAAVTAVDWFIRTFLNDVPLDAYGRDLFKKVNGGNETMNYTPKTLSQESR